MKIEFITQNTNLKKTETEYISKKLEKLSSLISNEIQKVVVLAKENKDFKKLEVNIYAQSDLIRAEEKGVNFSEIIDLAVDKLARQINKLREKMQSKRKAQVQSEEPLDLRKLEKEILAKQIIKNKEVKLKPMTKEEALLAMELLGHDFYIYYDVNLNKTCVVYKREDQDYAVIETDIE